MLLLFLIRKLIISNFDMMVLGEIKREYVGQIKGSHGDVVP